MHPVVRDMIMDGDDGATEAAEQATHYRTTNQPTYISLRITNRPFISYCCSMDAVADVEGVVVVDDEDDESEEDIG